MIMESPNSNNHNENNMNHTIEEIQTILFTNLDTLSHLLNNTQNDEEKNAIINTLTITHAKTFGLLNSRIIKYSNIQNKYTPFRGNLLGMNAILKDLEEMDDSSLQAQVNRFSQEFWITCKCTDFCHSRVSIEDTLSTFKNYYMMDKKTKSENIGVLLLNFKGKTDQRQSFHYNLAGISICETFFMFLHHIKEKALKRLQGKCKDISESDDGEEENQRDMNPYQVSRFARHWNSNKKVSDDTFDL